MSKSMKLLNNDQGFTILEVLVALTIVALIFISVPTSVQNNRKALETALDDIDRAVRTATNEAVLRNTVTRLTIEIDKAPIEYYVEYSTNADFLLADPEKQKEVQTLDEKSEEAKKKKAVNSSFSKIAEFENIKREIPDFIVIIGSYTGESTKMQKEGKASMYFYPSGERDGALIFFTSEEEIAALEIMPFQNKTKVYYEQIFMEETLDVEAQTRRAIEEIYSQWTR
jgi:prepilin-type N-terminal cleavage/methylation domain-containing protein